MSINQQSSASARQPELSAQLPKHVAIIMDGNGRWAELRNKQRSAGHRAGGRTVRRIIESAYSHKIPYLTLFAFSSENWQRPKKEVDLLMELFLRALRREIDELHEQSVRIRFIGDRAAFAQALQEAMLKAEQLTRANNGMTVNIAVGYGGRWDIVQACKRVAEEVQGGHISAGKISQESIERNLSLYEGNAGQGMPDPDLLIRTGGEQRISNFLLWQMAYTELYFCDTLWPDFDADGFEEALKWYAARQRRFGRVPEGQRNDV